MPQLDITSSISTAFNKFLHTAVEQNNSDSLDNALSFIRRICRDSIKYRKLKHFNDYIFFPTRIYLLLHSKQVGSSTLETKFSRTFIEILSLHLKEIIWFDINIFGKNANSTADKAIVNEFYKSAFLSFSNFFYNVISLKDWQTFHKAIIDYNALSEGVFDNSYQQKFELTRLKQEANFDPNNEAVKRLQLEVDENNKYQEYKRQILSGVKYWLIFLYDENIVNAEVLEKVLLETSENYTSVEDESKDILTMRSDFPSSFDWGRWDHIKRESGKIYFPPMVNDWMTLGFFISCIRERKLSFIVDNLNPTELNDVPFLYDKLVSLKHDVLANSEKWLSILHVEDAPELERLIDAFINSVEQAKRKNVGFREETIATAELSLPLIAEFQTTMGKSWKKEMHIREIFRYFNNCKDVSEEDIKLKFVGQRTFLEKAKMLFIEGEFHSKIYGLEQFGGQVGRTEDDLFFHVIKTSGQEEIVEKSITTLLVTGLKTLRDSGLNPNAIFIEPEYAYKDEELLNHPKFSNRAIIAEHNGTPLATIGSFDGVTIFWSFSRSLKNHALIAEFDSAFLMQFKTQEEWYDRVLKVLVEPISNELANEKLLNEPRKWRTTDEGIELSVQAAITLIKTSIIVEIGTILDFKILDGSKFVFGKVINAISD